MRQIQYISYLLSFPQTDITVMKCNRQHQFDVIFYCGFVVTITLPCLQKSQSSYIAEGRLANLDIYVGMNATDGDMCAYYPGPAAPSETVVVKCKAPLTGTFVRFTGGGRDCSHFDQPFLQFCEVEVMGYFPGTKYFRTKYVRSCVE